MARIALAILTASFLMLSAPAARASCGLDSRIARLSQLERDRLSATSPGVVSFVGAATSARVDTNTTDTVFAVEAVIQGTVAPGQIVTSDVGTIGRTSIAVSFPIGERFLVIGTRQTDGKLHTHACTGTRAVSRAEANALTRNFGQGSLPKGEDGTLRRWPVLNAAMGVLVVVAMIAWVLRYRRAKLAKAVDL